MTTKRAALVARVSTANQAEHGFSLSTQIAECKKYAERNGMIVAHEIQDAVSGTVEIREREGGKRLYKLVKDREIDAVIFYAIDRIARDEDVAELILLKRDLKRAGVELHYADSGKSDDSIAGGIVEYVKASYAADERKKIRERATRNLKEKARRGQWVGCGFVPYGYRKLGERKTTALEINADEAAMVRRIFAEYTGLNGDEPIPLLAIARRLTAEGIDPPKRKIRHTRGWWAGTVSAILKQRIYIGEFRYSDVSYSAPELAIIDRGIFDAAQKRRKRNSELSKRNQKREYLLSGYMRCACGMMFCRNSGNGKRYYRCNSQMHYYYLSECREKGLTADAIEAKVWNWLSELLTDERQLRLGLRRKAEQDIAANTHKRERLETVREMIPEVESSIKGLVMDLAALGNVSDIARANIREQIKGKQKLLDSLTAERDRLEAELERLELTPELEARILAEAAIIRDKIGQANFETKRFFLDKLGFVAKLRHDESGRWLDCSCALIVEVKPLSIESKASKETRLNQPLQQVIVFSTAIPIDDKQRSTNLAESLFASAGVKVGA